MKTLRSIALFVVLCLFIISGIHLFGKKLDINTGLNNNEDTKKYDSAYLDTQSKESDTEDTEEPETETQIEEMPHVTADEIEGTVPEGYFNDMLMVGDSRVFAIYEYGDASGAEFFAKDGLDVYKMKNTTLDTCGYEGITFTELLDKRQFKRIYFMIGINELGNNLDTNIVKYEEWVDLMLEKQPDAQLVICANLHVEEKHEKRFVNETNANIDYVNAGMKKIADDRGLLYIDVNEIFDDENHYLGAQYSGDGCHPYGKYMKIWSVWLANYVRY